MSQLRATTQFVIVATTIATTNKGAIHGMMPDQKTLETYIHQSRIVLEQLRQYGNVTTDPEGENLADMAHAVLSQHEWLSEQQQQQKKGGEMRKQLASLVGRKASFTATFDHFGKRVLKDRVLHFMLVTDVRDIDEKWHIAHHVWVQLNRPVMTQLEPGDRIAFRAEVYSYHKYKHGMRQSDVRQPDRRQTEYGLCRPERVKVLRHQELQEQRKGDEAS
jgi:hypothetical protein